MTYDQTENPVGFQQSTTNNAAEAESSGCMSKKRKDRGDMPDAPAEGQEFTFPSREKGRELSDGSYQVLSINGLSKKFKKDSPKAKDLFKKTRLDSERSARDSTSYEERKPKTESPSKEAQTSAS